MHEELISKIKAKKPLNRLDDEFVDYFIVEFFKSNPKLKKKFLDGKLKKKDFEFVVKNVRNGLNRIYGQFWIDDNLSLESHVSTKERINDFIYIYNILFN